MAARRIGERLGIPNFMQLIVDEIAMQAVHGAPVRVEPALPVAQVGHPVAAVDLLDALVCEQDLERSTVVFHHGERLVCQVVDASQGKIVVAPARCDDGDSLLPAETAHQLAGHGLAEQVALHFLAADGAQELVLLFGLDPLGERPHTNGLRHANRGFDDGAGLLAAARQEAHVDLYLVEGIVLQDSQRRESATEVVHPDLVASAPEGSERLSQGGSPCRSAPRCKGRTRRSCPIPRARG